MNKYSILIIAQVVLMLTMSSCNGCKSRQTTSDTIEVVGLDTHPGIVEMHGRVGDGTSMNELEVITPKGDTVIVSIAEEMIKGDVKAGDDVEVIYYANQDENLASIVVNLTALRHLWTTIRNGQRQSFELNKDGVAISYDMGVDYAHWHVKDGNLILQDSKPIGSERAQRSDTFEIMSLTTSQLVLMKQQEELVFEMEN